MVNNILVVGLGLIGGSLVKALKSLDTYSVFGLDQKKEVVQICYDSGWIKNSTELESNVIKSADLIILCLYPQASIDFVKKHQDLFKKSCILTDVTGLKSSFMYQIKSFLREDSIFIGGHPMAGKEGSGYHASSETIFLDANYLLIKEDHIAHEHYKTLEQIIYGIGFGHIEYLSIEEHDKIIAYTSHMPHLLATTLMSCDRFEKTKYCIAGSFVDVTRVSDINEELWTELFLENKVALLEEIQIFKETLEKVEHFIKETSTKELQTFFSSAKSKKILLKS